METTKTSLRYFADKGYKDALRHKTSYLHITESEFILTNEDDDINNSREQYDIKSISGYEKGMGYNLSIFVDGKEIVYRVFYKKDEIIAALELRRRDIFNQDCEELPKLTDGDISINKKTYDYNMIRTQELGQNSRGNLFGKKILKAQKKTSKIIWVVLEILLIILLVLNLSGCSNQTFERRALSFVQSNDIETYVVFHSQKNHLVLFKNAGDSLGVYDLKSQKHKSIGSTYSLGIQKAFPSATLFSERKMAINNVKSLYLTSNERNGVILVSEFVHDGGVSEEVVTLILPDEEAFSELCRGSDIRIFNDNVIECYNYEKPSDFEYVSISKGEKVSTSHRYCGFLGNNASSLVNGSLIAVDSLLLGSFYTNNPYDRVSVCGTKKSYGDTNVKLKSIDGNSEIALESDFYMSHLKVSAIGLPNLPARMELFDIKQTGDWEIGRYQDVMGNTLPEFYIWKSISSNGKKIGSFIIDKEGINIELFESYDTVPIHGHGTMNWIVQYGSRYDQFKFKSYNDRNGENRVSDSYFNNLLYILSLGNNLKFHADDSDLGDLLFNLSGDQYDFEINTAYFTNAWFDMLHRRHYLRASSQDSWD